MELTEWARLPTTIVVCTMQVLCLFKLATLMRARWREWWPSLMALVNGSMMQAEDSESTEMCEHFQRRLVDTRVQCARVSAFFYWVLSTVICFQLVFSDIDLFTAPATEGSKRPRLVMMILFAPAGLFPERVLSSETRCRVLHALTMLCACWVAFLPPTMDGRVWKLTIIALIAVCVATLYPRFCANIVPNLCITVCCIASDILFELETVQPITIVLVDLVMLAFRLAAVFCGIFVLELYVKKEVAAGFDLCKESAVSSLLGMVCDVRVDLDEDLRLKSHSQQLAGMLMHGPGRLLKGESLLSFMPDEEDRTRFQALLRSTSGSCEAELAEPSTLTVRLRDSIGNHVRVALFHVPYVSMCGCVHHLVGLREDVDFSSNVDKFSGQASLGIREGPAGELRPEIALQMHIPRSATDQRRGICESSLNSSLSGGGYCGKLSAAACSATVEKPDIGRSLEVFYLEPGMPIRWAGGDILQDLAMEKPVGEFLPQLGSMLPDAGIILSTAIRQKIKARQKQQKEGSFCVCLGEWELMRTCGNGAESRKEIVRRVLWVNFFLPLLECEDMPYVAIAVTNAAPRRSAGYGTAAASTPHSLVDLTADVGDFSVQAL